MKVYQFGGASVKDAAGVRNLKEIVAHAGDDLMVVVSAMGKTTNALERLVAALSEKNEEVADNEWLSILDMHVHLAMELGLKPNEDIRFPMMPEYDHTCSYDQNYDQIVSLGEIMSTQIVAVFLLKSGIPTEWWNMPKLLRTDNTYREAVVDMQTSAQVIAAGWNRPSRPQVVVAQGFIGGTADGQRTTLGREGSDYTAALLGNFIGAESVTIWKDVPGILNADPRLVPNTVKIDRLTYYDAVELAYSGAQIIHPKTIKPLQNKNIPLYVKPFGNKHAAGTEINASAAKITTPIIILKRNQSFLRLRSRDLSFVLEEKFPIIFATLERFRIKTNLIHNTAVELGLCVEESWHLEEVATALREEGFNTEIMSKVELLTIRHYNDELLNKYVECDDFIISQLTPDTVRYVKPL